MNEIADELEASPRTIRRDLEALSIAGVPVYSQAGRGGGWSLIGGARTDLTGLTSSEAQALFTVAGPAAAATPELKAALRKLVAALPEPFRADATSAAESVVVDPTSWGRVGRVDEPPHLDALRRAVVAGVQVTLGYATPGKPPSTRVVSPLGLVVKASVWYLIAGTDAGRRSFRVGRVRSVTPLDLPVERPADFDLEEAWTDIKVQFADTLRQVVATGWVEPWVIRPLRSVVGSKLIVHDERDERGRYAITLSSAAVTMLAADVAGFGAAVVIEDPAEVREQLLNVGQELCELYG